MMLFDWLFIIFVMVMFVFVFGLFCYFVDDRFRCLLLYLVFCLCVVMFICLLLVCFNVLMVMGYITRLLCLVWLALCWLFGLFGLVLVVSYCGCGLLAIVVVAFAVEFYV